MVIGAAGSGVLLHTFCPEPFPPGWQQHQGIDDQEDRMITTSGLEYKDLKQGAGETATRGDRVVVHYTGWLTDGKQFDSSLDGEPFAFTLGVGEVIAGWDEGISGMKVGDKRKLWIPAKLGYGRRGAPPEIPPNAELVFEVELLEIRK
jgi:FKBP-type peptidyl-prolyl cis-trans isomerase